MGTPTLASSTDIKTAMLPLLLNCLLKCQTQLLSLLPVCRCSLNCPIRSTTSYHVSAIPSPPVPPPLPRCIPGPVIIAEADQLRLRLVQILLHLLAPEGRGEEGRGEQAHERRGEQAHERRGEQAHYYMSASIELAGGRNLTPSPSLTMSC